MIHITKRSLVWIFILLFWGVMIHQTWYSVQWIFTATDHTTNKTPSTTHLPTSPSSSTASTLSPSLPNTHTSSTSTSRYQRDYTTLVAYTIILFVLYCLLFVKYRQSRLSPSLNLTPATNLSPENNNKPVDDPLEPQQRQPSFDIKRPSPLYLLGRRWWHYEIRCCDNTFHVGTYTTLLGLLGIHGLLIVWPLLRKDTVISNKYLTQQLISNRIAQLAVMDIAVAVALSVRTSGVWRMIGLHNGSSTLPWHRWFSRLGVLCAIYHGCFQWTKHYYQYYPNKHQLKLLQLVSYLTSDDTIGKGGLSNTTTWWDLITANPHYLTGNLMALCLLVLFLGSHPLIRVKWYALFKSTHVVAFMGLVAVGMWHHWAFAIFYAFVAGFWLVDLVARWRSSQLTPILAFDVITKDVIKLQVMLETPPSACRCRRPSRQRDRHHLPGQYVFCSFSGAKWKGLWWSHPFSISHIEYLEKADSTDLGQSQILTFYIKACGKQTKRLYEVANVKDNWPVVRLGPSYTSAYCHRFDCYGLYPVVVLVAEGIGITPWMAVLQSLVNGFDDNNKNNGHHLTITEHVHLVWTVRDTSIVHTLRNDFQAMMAATTSGSRLFHLDWHIFVTGVNTYQHEQEQDISSSSSLPTSLPPREYLHSHQGRPDYPTLLESIRLKHEDKNVALGICAREESVKVCGNLARSSRFSNKNTYWNVKSERFDL